MSTPEVVRARPSRPLLRRLLQTETKWNPKVMVGRVVLRVLPEPALHRLKKRYYAYLISHRPESWMEEDAAVCASLISPNDTVLDIGASLGSFSLFMAKRAAKVYAFEPIPQTFDFLKNNMRRMQVPNVECLNLALSDRDDEQVMIIPKSYDWGQECWYDARVKTANAKPGAREIKVISRTLDSLNPPPISFIKCDANFHELWVLTGALETIKRDHPAMLIEVNPDPDNETTSAFKTFELLQAEGYEGYWFDGAGLHLRQRGERSQNYFFLRPEHVAKLPAQFRFPTEFALPEAV